ncbi:MAG: beta-lactamase family protein [Spirochaetaceae bacterium]|nr:beta-lactamase family protein [Spirochaetaceae bacterium]
MKIKSTILCGTLIILCFMIAIFFHLDTWGNASTLAESTERIIRTHRIPSCVTALIQQENIEYESHTLNGEELPPSSLFLSGGITEILTGISLNILFEDGILSPSDPITKFYPWLTFTYKDELTDITISQLASHSSGIPIHTQDELIGAADSVRLRAALRNSSGAQLSFLPGTAYRHVETDYAILAFIIEKVTGSSWAEYVTKNVIEPLGLTRTYLSYDSIPQYAKVVRGSRTCASFIMNYDIKLNEANTPSKGMITCAEDLTHFVRVLSGKRAAPEKLTKAMESLLSMEYCAFSPEETTTDAFYGGLFFSAAQNAFYRDGGIENYSTSIWFNVESEKGVVVQCSGMKAPSDKILENCLKSLDDKDDFLLSFISTETFDVVGSVLCLALFFLCIFNFLAMVKRRKRRYSSIRSVTGIILSLLFMVCTALFPFYFDCTYRMIFTGSVLIITIIMGLSQIFGILSIVRIALNRKVDFRSGRGFGW